jgi:hypothetical protein
VTAAIAVAVYHWLGGDSASRGSISIVWTLLLAAGACFSALLAT